MTFRINLAACLVLVVGSLAIGLLGPNPVTFRPSDLAILLFIWSPAMLWAGGAVAFRNRDGFSILWLCASILFIGGELIALHLQVEQARQEAITHQQTQPLLAFLVILLEWAAGLPLLVLLALIWRALRVVDDEG